MSTLAERIKSERTALKLTQSELGDRIGVGKSSVSQWENGFAKKIDGVNMVKAAKALGVNPDWLATGKGLKYKAPLFQSNAHESPNLGEFSFVPVVGSAQLGDNGHWSDLEYPAGHGDGYIRYPTKDPNAYALRCHGDSMKPRIKHGEFVIVEPNSAPQNGDEVLVRTNDDRVMVKTFLYKREGRVHLISINEAHPPQSIAFEDIEVIHPVVAIVKKTLWVNDSDK